MEIKPGYKQTEVGVIPEDWQVDYLPKICMFRAGKAHEQFISLNGDYICVNSKFISSDGKVQKRCSRNVCPAKKGDVLMVMSDLPNGKALAKAFVVSKEDLFAVNQRVCALSPHHSVSEYLYYVLNRSPYFLKHDDGVNQTHLLNPVFMKCLIPLPSLMEQKAISKALVDIDSLITSLEKLIEKKKLIKKGVMQELLTGKGRLPGFSGEWETKRYGDIFQFISSANYTREDLTDTGSIRYIHYGDIHTKFENYVDLSDASIPTIQDCKLKNYPLLETGDLIMVDASEDYSGVGKSVEVINQNGCKAISGLHTILLRDTSKTFADGYRAFIHSIPSVKAQLDFYATGMKVYSISKGNLAIIEIPVPPKNEQEAIVNALSSFVDEIKALEVRLAKSTLLKQAMMQELLTGRIRLI